jgi:uncharacterized protein YjbI with pentapeptide repeats
MMRNRQRSTQQPKPISEALIKAKAYEIWRQRKAKGKDGDSEGDWLAAIASLNSWHSRLGFRLKLLFTHLGKSFIGFLGWWLTLPWRLLRALIHSVVNLWAMFADKDSRGFALDVVKTWISFLGLSATIIAGIGFYLNYQQGQEKLVTERFSTSVTQIGNDKKVVRIGGIYSLERIAKDSPKDHWTIMEVLTAYVRQNSPLPPEGKATSPIPIDIQSALTVIRRRNSEQESVEKRLDLSFSNLSGAELWDANLSGAKLGGANLSEADLRGANLSGADLFGANLTRASLWKANLFRADLGQANLFRANLFRADLARANLSSGANLSGANLSEANLSGAILSEADLSEANLSGASFSEASFSEANLSEADLSEANLEGARLFEANLEGTNLSGADLTGVEYLTVEQVKSARHWQQAIYDDDFRKKLGLPPSRP